MRYILVCTVFLGLTILKISAYLFVNSRIRTPYSSQLFAKSKNKKKRGQGAPAPSKGERQGQEDTFDAITRKYMFTCSKLNKAIPDGSRQVLKDINLMFYPGAKIGVVGLNGSGKTSLLKIMAGIDNQFDGTAVPMPGASIGYLPQEPQLEGQIVLDHINQGVEKGQNVLDEFNELSLKCADPDLNDNEIQKIMDELSELQDKIDAGNLWELDRFKKLAMQSLNCPPPNTDINVLSGGERRRVAIAKLLLENNDMLLLDEPTNHLDCQSISWLEKYLQEFKGTVVAITHDRYFLENSCSWILELDRGQGIPHEGNYSSWLEKKQKRLITERKHDDRLKKQIEQELNWVKSTPKAKTTKSKARLNRYEEMISTPARELQAHSTSIYIPPGPRLGDVVVKAEGICKGYGDRTLIKDLSFDIPPGAIVGVVGPNGAGKTTLVNLITGKEKVDSGIIKIGQTVKWAVVEQNRESLDGSKSVYDEITGGQDFISLGSAEVNGRAYCTWFGFKGSDQQKLVDKISGGERNRVQLAKVLRSGSNFIILDEPTNDLDVQTISSLEEALLEFGGCVLVVSHDRYFLDRITTHILAYDGNGKVDFFTGNFGDYQAFKALEAK
jgi:energy-dependent translational throttle protein EttA